MAERVLIRDIYNVETDETDWPSGLGPSEKECLQRVVLEILRACPSLCTYELYQRVRRHRDVPEGAPTFRKAALLDWLYACVVRAARGAGCEQRWHAPPPLPPNPSAKSKPTTGRKRAKADTKQCADCGEKGETTGHMGCQYPQNRD